MRNYSQFFAILKKIGRDKEDVVDEFTEGRTESLSALTDGEFKEMMTRLAKFNTPPLGNDQRRKIIALAKNMRWGKNTRESLIEIDKWLLNQKYQKPLMQLDLQQLGVMVTVLEQKVYPDYLKGLNK